MLYFIGYLAAILFALSGIPFAWSTYRAGRTDMSVPGILVGSTGMLIFEAGTSQKLPQLLDFTFNTVVWGTVLFYRLMPRYK